MRTLAVVLLLSPLGAAGQVSIGARAGLNASSFAPDLYVAEEVRVAPTVAVFADGTLRGPFGVFAEALYSAEGVDLGPEVLPGSPDDLSRYEGGAVHADYLGGGVYARVQLPFGGLTLAPYGGPTVTFKVRETRTSRYKGQEGSARDSDFLAPTNVSGTAGLRAERGRGGLDLRYSLGVYDGFNGAFIGRLDGSPVVRRSVAALSATYRIGR